MQLKKLSALLIISYCCFVGASTAAWAVSEKQEVEIGKQGAARAVQKYGIVKDKSMLLRAKKLGKRLAANAQRKNIKYQFSVLNCKEVNAMAFPGGYIFFTKGIIKLMDDELLAFVAGHEISHVEHRDSVKAIESAQRRMVGIALLQRFVKGADSDLSRSIMGMTNAVVSNRYSQSAEFAADKNGIFLMAAAGYNPYKSVDALKALQKLGGKDMPGFLNSFLSTHPITTDRIERAEAIAPEAADMYPDSIPETSENGDEAGIEEANSMEPQVQQSEDVNRQNSDF
ncbi:MAG: M48 family metalloprotease [bacterium]|nr:M48 family metalloprotease [bacterium]